MQAFTDGSASIEPRQEPTGLPMPTLQWVGRSIATVPEGFSLHPEVRRMLDARRCAVVTASPGRRFLQMSTSHQLCSYGPATPVYCSFSGLDLFKELRIPSLLLADHRRHHFCMLQPALSHVPMRNSGSVRCVLDHLAFNALRALSAG